MKRTVGILWACGLLLAGCGGGGTSGEIDNATRPDVAGDVADVGDEGQLPDGSDRDVPPVDPGQGDVPSCMPDQACDDGDPCTADDRCSDQGVCEGTPVAGCDDGLECTADACPEAGDCTHDLQPGWCLVDGFCFEDGEVDPANPCQACVTALFTDRFVIDDTLSCDDEDPCTIDDRCAEGLCVGGGPKCVDGNPCTTDQCDGGNCTFVPRPGESCDDGNACTIDDACNGDACEGAGRSCDDDNLCTTDGCDPATGCTFVFNAEPCDDANECTVGDTCARGACVPGEGRMDCDDEDVCTDDYCVPGEGCVHVANTAFCTDGDPCTVGDQCRRGECIPGQDVLACEDDNPCTDNVCTPFVGCEFPNNSAPCDDGEFCTVGDTCGGGTCQPGTGKADCDDGNICTDDNCVPGGEGCVYWNNVLPCDDGNACTGLDVCAAGKCAGVDQSELCEDGLVCTIDSCSPKDGCVRKVDNRPECRPQVVIDYPPRGVTLDGEQTVNVMGHIEYGLDGDQRFPQMVLINGTPVLPMPPMWSFTFPIVSEQGMNPIVVDVDDSLGQKDHVVQSYYYSTQYYPVDIADPAASQIADGLVLFLGPEVWDDNDTSDVDDIATIIGLYLANMDLSTLITNPVTTGSTAGCDYKVNVYNIRYGTPTVDLVPTNGGLNLGVTIPNFRADIDIPTRGTFCVIPDIDGDVTATSVTITGKMNVALDPTGQPVVTMTNVVATVNGLNVDIGGVLGFLTNWLINFFEGSFADMIEDALVDQISSLADSLEDALAGLALNESFEIPSFIEGGAPTTLSLVSKLSRLDFTPAGGTVGMAATIVAPKGTPHNPLGSIGRAACLTGVPEAMPGFPVGTPIPTPPALELGLHDDFLNLIPYALYWAGTLTMPIPQEMLGQDLSSYGITDMSLNVDFMLPPILTGCNDDGLLTIQAGDIGVQADMKLFGMPVQMQMFASFEADAEIVTVDGEAGKEISIAVREPTFIDIEIASLSGGLVGAEDTLGGLIRDTLMPELLGALTGESLGSFPIPEFDLSGLMEGLPPDTAISIEIREVLRRAAYTVLSGNVK